MRKFSDFDFLSHEKLADNLYRVVEDFGGPQKICMYVVTGKEKTAVIDTGLGATKGLRRYIETYITPKAPMIALMTHSHPDHIGGCSLFDEQYIHPDEVPQLAWGLNNKRRVHDASAFAFTGMPGSKTHAELEHAMAVKAYCRENHVDVDYHQIDFKLVEHGDQIDLGGIILECVYMNAHGSMVYYNRAQNYALCGDNFTYTLGLGNITWDLVKRFERFMDRFNEQTMFYSGHIYYEDMVTRPQEIDAPLIHRTIQAMRDVLSGKKVENEEPLVLYDYPDAPTLIGFVPDPGDEECWAAMRATHPERKGQVPKKGPKYVCRIGPVLLKYVKEEA